MVIGRNEYLKGTVSDSRNGDLASVSRRRRGGFGRHWEYEAWGTIERCGYRENEQS
jgi:hypothetical protein